MRVVTLNTWKNDGDYPLRLPLMAAQLGALSADVICLQECFAGGVWDTAAHLAHALGLHAVAQPARAKLREYGSQWMHSTSGLAILSRERALTHGRLSLSADDRDGERIALRADLPGLRILNLHLTHLRGASAGELRATQLAEGLSWARADWTEALLVCGDLNCGRGDPEFAVLEAAAGPEPGPTLHAGGAARAIDHVVLAESGGFAVRRRAVALQTPDDDGRYPSDHAAVVVDLART